MAGESLTKIIIGDLIVELGMDAKDLILESKEAQGELDSLAAKVGNVTGVLAAFGVAAAGLAAGVLVAFTKSSLENVDAQSKLAERLGASLAAVQALDHAAALADVSHEDLAHTLDRVNSVLGEVARTGSGPAYESLQKLGLSAKELSGMDADKRLEAIADRMRDLGYSASQVAYVLQTFGIRNKEVTNLIARGGDDIRDARKELDELGASLSNIDGKQIEAANDALTRINFIFEAIGNQLALKLAPYIQVAADEFFDWAKGGTNIAGVLDTVFATVLDWVGKVQDGFYYLDGAGKSTQLVMQNLAVGIDYLFLGTAKDIDGLVQMITKIGPAFAVISPGLFAASQMLQGTTAGWVASTQETLNINQKQLDELNKQFVDWAKKPLPSTSLDSWEKQVKDKVAAAAKAIDDAMKGRPTAGTGGGTGANTGMTDQQKADQEKLKQLEATLGTQLDIEMTHYQDSMDELEKFHKEGLLSDADFAKDEEKLETQHQAKLKQIRTSGLLDLQKFTAMSWDEQVSTVATALLDMTNNVKDQNDILFDINKGAAVANAVINTYEGISKTLATYPFPLSIAMAAVQAAAGIAQVTAILSTTRDTTSVTNTASGASAGAGRTDTTTSTPAAAPDRTLFVRGIRPGDLFSGGAVRDLAQSLLDYQSDGGKVVLS